MAWACIWGTVGYISTYGLCKLHWLQVGFVYFLGGVCMFDELGLCSIYSLQLQLRVNRSFWRLVCLGRDI